MAFVRVLMSVYMASHSSPLYTFILQPTCIYLLDELDVNDGDVFRAGELSPHPCVIYMRFDMICML